MKPLAGNIAFILTIFYLMPSEKITGLNHHFFRKNLLIHLFIGTFLVTCGEATCNSNLSPHIKLRQGRKQQ
jgi:hypothetical protein